MCISCAVSGVQVVCTGTSCAGSALPPALPPLVAVLEGGPFKRWKGELHANDFLPSVSVDFCGDGRLHATRVLVSQLLPNTCVTIGITTAK